METITFLAAVGEAIDAMGDVLSLFMQKPTVYFVALGFASGAAGVALKFIPMKKR